MKKNYDAILSYSQKDRECAKELAQRLVEAGFSVFYDDSKLANGDSCAKSLADALRNARATLVIMSPDYFASDWSRSELEISIALELEDTEREGGRIVPLLLRDCDIPPLLQARTYADCRTDVVFEKAFSLIVDSLKAQVSPDLRGDSAIARGHGSVAVGSRGVFVGGDSTGIINIGHIVSQEDTVALRSQLEELQKRVDAVTGNSPASSSSLNNQEFRLSPNLCFVAMPFGSNEQNDIYKYFVKPSIEPRSA
jgi:hypothetical protein